MKCNVCGQDFDKQSLYRKHMDQHAEEKPHRCPKCSASFNIPVNCHEFEQNLLNVLQICICFQHIL